MATAAIPPAFVAELVDDIGAYAGIAAIVGLAVLTLLYFTQAREVKRLREWVGRTPEREAELAARVRAEAMRQRTSVAPGVPRPTGNGQQAPRPVQPPGVPAAPPTAAPPPTATTAATPPAPAPAPAGQPGAASPAPQAPGQGAAPDQPPPTVPAPATAAARPSSPEAASAQASGGTAGGGAPPTEPAAGASPTQPPAGGGASPTQSPAGDQHTEDRQASRGTVAATAGGRGGTAPSDQGAAPLRRTAASSKAVHPRGPRPKKPPPPPPVAGAGDGRGARMVALIVGGALVALVVGVLLITQVFTGGYEGEQGAGPSNSAAPAQAPEEGPPPRGEVNVAVLNGTTVSGLADDVAAELEESGFQRGEVATNVADQTLAETKVQFAEGSRESALEVAEVLGLREEAVEPLERNTRVAAGEEAAVVVLVGNDGVGNPTGAQSGGGAPEDTGGAVAPQDTGGAVAPEDTGGAVAPEDSGGAVAP